MSKQTAIHQKRRDEPMSHEVYIDGTPMATNLTRAEAKQQRRALQRRVARWQQSKH